MANDRNRETAADELRDLDRKRTGGTPTNAYDDRVDRTLQANADRLRESITDERDRSDRERDDAP